MSHVTPLSSTLVLRACVWQRDLDRLGITLPFSIIHDVGMLFAAPEQQLSLGLRCELEALLDKNMSIKHLLKTYQDVIEGVFASEAARRAREQVLSDNLISALLARILGGIAKQIRTRRPYLVQVPSDPRAYELNALDLASLWSRTERSFEIDALGALVQARLYLLTLTDVIDPNTLRLIGMLGQEAELAGVAQVDLLGALSNPEAFEVVRFALEILPSVLETKPVPGASTHAASGLSGIGTRGSIDSLVLTELAWDEEEFLRRIIDDEVLYYTRDQVEEQSKRIHYILIDASASMRGERTTFARGLALARAKKLCLAGEEVVFRFFDARLYESARVRGKNLPTPYVLAFRGERGRNPIRVFNTLTNELQLARARDAREPFVHLFTHASQDIPRPVVASLCAQARLSAVFIAPHGNHVDLGYLDLLDAYWVVSHDTLAEQQSRAETALAILHHADPPKRSKAEV
jgi:hypothetical protein